MLNLKEVRRLEGLLKDSKRTIKAKLNNNYVFVVRRDTMPKFIPNIGEDTWDHFQAELYAAREDLKEFYNRRLV